ncbi:MAG: hypothetical protein ACXWC9_07865 [Pseudobdellovibrionaceae bacterium]
MNLQRFLTYLISLLLLLPAACSVYKSTGRKSFEDKSAGNIRTSSLSLKIEGKEELADTCWNQPSADPLWHIDSNQPLTVSSLNNEEIQVCIQDF